MNADVIYHRPLSRTGHAEDTEIVLLIDAPHLIVPHSMAPLARASFYGAPSHRAMEQNHPLIPSFLHT